MVIQMLATTQKQFWNTKATKDGRKNIFKFFTDDGFDINIESGSTDKIYFKVKEFRTEEEKIPWGTFQILIIISETGIEHTFVNGTCFEDNSWNENQLKMLKPGALVCSVAAKKHTLKIEKDVNILDKLNAQYFHN